MEDGHNQGVSIMKYHKATRPPLQGGDPYCAAFLVWALRTAAHELGVNIPADWPRSGYCPDHKNWAKRKGLWIPKDQARAKAKPGDLVCYYFAAKERVAHIGILKAVNSDRKWVVIEGNTGPSGALNAVNREGDGVFAKLRTVSSLGEFGGLIRLPWS
jgi:hypothetical protein